MNANEQTKPVSNEYSVLVLDDHPVVLEGVRHLLSAQPDIYCQTVASSTQMLALLEQARCYDLFILDLELPDIDGFTALSAIRQHCPRASVLIYTMHEEPWVVAQLAHFDIQGIVSKDSPVSSLLDAVSTIRRGGTYYNETYLHLLQQISGIGTSAKALIELSEREQQVLDCICQGLNTQQISERLFLSVNTVGTYRRRLMTKFDAHNVAQLIAKASQQSFRNSGFMAKKAK